MGLLAITFYQRFLSPWKGFRCAHAAYFGGISCSEAIKRYVASNDWRTARQLAKQRFAECRHACAMLHETREDQQKRRQRVARNERHSKWDWCDPGVCDLGELVFALARGMRSLFRGFTSSAKNCDYCDIGPCDCSW